ncbi:MAG: DUF975 family protein [Fusicatenibacter sp.]|nr:DUF975 family protein [Lachnospiraceae bacterium]MDY2937066.1 DUF975 family protein [Fusicatenibacter sp.]
MKKRKSSELKKYSREAMVGRYGVLAGSTALYLLLSLFCSMMPALVFSGDDLFNTILFYITTFLFLLLVNLLNVGYSRISLTCLRQEKPSVGDLLHAFFHHPDRYLLMYLIPTGISFAISLAADFFSTCVLNELSAVSVDLYGTTLSYMLCILAVSALSNLISLLVLLPFSLAAYVMLDSPDLGPLQSLKESARLMKKNKLRFLYLTFSFFGIYLLGSCSCGIGFLWVMPYMETTISAFYLDLKNEL